MEVDTTLLVPDPTLTIDEGAIEPWRNVAADSGWTRASRAHLQRSQDPARRAVEEALRQQRDQLLTHG